MAQYVIHGKKTCWCGLVWIRAMEVRLREARIIKKDLSGLIMQGGYNAGGVAASAGIHDKGGAFDFSEKLATPAFIKIARELGAAAWIRLESDDRPAPGKKPWDTHVHVILDGCPHAADGGKSQVLSYRAGKNGLTYDAADREWRPQVFRTWSQACAVYAGRRMVVTHPKGAPRRVSPNGKLTGSRVKKGAAVLVIAEKGKAFQIGSGRWVRKSKVRPIA
ncbi:MAG: hypothetical protein FWD59_06745 [Micrococcales bacterium]|nr:hypothetical protein [Micrococcales bacterium]